MEQENIEAIRIVYAEISERLDVPESLFDPDFEMNFSELAGIGVQRGLAAAREVFRQYATTFDDFTVEIRDVIHADDQLVVVGLRDGGRLKGGSAEIWNDYFDVWRFRNGKIASVSAHTDRARALKVAGLSD